MSKILARFADAYAISPILRARIEELKFPVAVGPTTIDIQLDISQAMLDAVAKAIYAKKLLIDPQMVEGLLLLADYLEVAISSLMSQKDLDVSQK